MVDNSIFNLPFSKIYFPFSIIYRQVPMDEILSIILKDTYSLSQLKHRLRILKNSLLQDFFGETHLEGGPGLLPGGLSPEDLNWLKTLSPAFYQKFTKDNVYEIFSDLDSSSLKLATLTLYLSFEPDNITTSQIGSFARKTLNSPALLLDIKLDPRLIAGTALSWKGVYKDYSLRAQLAVKKQELWEEFKKFLR